MQAIRAINLPFLPEPLPTRQAVQAPVAAPSTAAWLQDQFQLGFGNESAPTRSNSLLSWLRQRVTNFVQGMRNPLSFFITQYKSAFNTNEDVAGNGNCGPTSLAMVAMAFGKVNVTAAQADGVIEQTRRAMTGVNNEHAGTSFAQLARGAASYGLQSREVGGSLMALQAELAEGRLPIALISPREFRNSTSRGHYVVITKIDEQGVHCNDPAIRSGPIVISRADFLKGWGARGSKAISIGA